MQGNQKVLNGLNELLAYELAAMDQYFIHAQMYLDWGFNKLYERINHEFDDEKGHATKLIDRMLMLGFTPDMTQRTVLKWVKTYLKCWKAIYALNTTWVTN